MRIPVLAKTGIRASRLTPDAALRAHAPGVLGPRGRFAEAVLAGQLAALLTPVGGAMLFGRTLWNLYSVNGGFQQKNIVYAVLTPRDRWAASAQKEIAARLSASPHIASVTMAVYRRELETMSPHLSLVFAKRV